MTETKKHGRRRAGAPKRRNGQAKNVGTVLVAGGLLIAITSPALAIDDTPDTTGSVDSSKSVVDAASTFMSLTRDNGPITADPNAKITFVMTSVTSQEGPETKLKKEREEKAVKDAEAVAHAVKLAAEEEATKKASPSATINKLEAAGFTASSSESASSMKPSKLLAGPMKVLKPSSSFGIRVSPITGAVDEFHRGQDYAAACGTEVMAAAGGTVIYTQWHPYGGGNRVEIDHGNGLITTYNHLSASSVKVGQKVERGDVIALAGTTGASTGCHLHFEVMVNKDVVDPLPWL